jgi:hypothetical protein
MRLQKNDFAANFLNYAQSRGRSLRHAEAHP